MPLVWKDGRKVEGTMEEYIAQLRAVADRMDKRFSIFSDERGLIGDFLRGAADQLEKGA